MVISHKYKFIFIKTKKTAGTSIEVFLSGVCAEDDTLTPFGPIEPPHGPPEPGHRPRNYKGRGVKEHLSARILRSRTHESIWNNYFKFCVERNPWDKCLSHYYWRKRGYESDRDMTLDDYFTDRLRRFREDPEDWQGFPTDFKKYTDENGNLEVDRVLRYESLNEELTEVFQMLNIPFDGRLGVYAKRDPERDRRDYREVLSPQQAEHIRRIFKSEIDMFGYEY